MANPSFNLRPPSDEPTSTGQPQQAYASLNNRVAALERESQGRALSDQRIKDQSTTLFSVDPHLQSATEIINAWRFLGLFPGKQLGAFTILILGVATAEEVVVRLLLK